MGEIEFGALSLIPVIVVIVVATLTRRTIEPLLLGALIGFVILDSKNAIRDPWSKDEYGVAPINPEQNFFFGFVDWTYEVLTDPVTIWVIIIVALLGCLIALLEKSGGAHGFSKITAKIAKDRKSTLVVTWILGIVIFIDEYLNALAVGTAMRKATDDQKVSREFLAFIINSTGATVCVLIPFSSWGAYMAAQMVASGLGDGKGVTATYLSTLPWILYAWIAIIIVPLFIAKILPVWGPMKKAELRAAGGQTLPDSTYKTVGGKTEDVAAEEFASKARAYNFIVPLLVVAVITLMMKDYSDVLIYAAVAGLVTCAAMYLPQRLMKPSEFLDTALIGFRDMMPVLLIGVSAYILQRANNQLGMTEYVIEKVSPIMSGALLPMVTFIIIGALAFASGSYWGVAAIAFPIVIPLAAEMGVSGYLVAGAVVSAAALGSHACFYGDAVNLTCASAQITNGDYAKAVLPLVGLPFALGVIAFLITGLIIY